MDEAEEPPKRVECRIMRNDGKGWYWEVVAGHEVLARGLAKTEDGARTQAVDAKRSVRC